MKQGAKVCVQNKLGHYPIHAAAFAGARKALEVILTNGTERTSISFFSLNKSRGRQQSEWIIQTHGAEKKKKNNVQACTRARCHRLTVCLSMVGGLFGEPCAVVGGFSTEHRLFRGKKKTVIALEGFKGICEFSFCLGFGADRTRRKWVWWLIH